METFIEVYNIFLGFIANFGSMAYQFITYEVPIPLVGNVSIAILLLGGGLLTMLIAKLIKMLI